MQAPEAGTTAAAAEVVKDLFGSNREDEEEGEAAPAVEAEEPAEKSAEEPAKEPVKEPAKEVEEEEEFLPPKKKKSTAEQVVGELFGSDDEDESDEDVIAYKRSLKGDAGDAGQTEAKARKKKLQELQDRIADVDDGPEDDEDGLGKTRRREQEDAKDEEEEEEEEEETVEDLAFACEYEKTKPTMEDVKLTKLSNIVGVEKQEFSRETFKAEEEAYHDETGQIKVRLRDQNVIRWRKVNDGAGGFKLESNARIVRWSDGSTQLLLGEETFNVDTKPVVKVSHNM